MLWYCLSNLDAIKSTKTHVKMNLKTAYTLVRFSKLLSFRVAQQFNL